MDPVSKTTRNGGQLATRIYARLLDAILDEEFPPDSRLVQADVAQRLGVSRTPVRDALNRLAVEGVVTWVAGSGYLVNDLTSQGIEHVNQVRQALETLAARLACGRHTALELARLDSLVNEMAAEDVDASARHFHLNREFHAALVAPCGNPLLVSIIDSLWDHPTNRRLTRVYVNDREALDTMVAEHRAIIDAARVADAERLVACVSDHIILSHAAVRDRR